MKDEEWGKDLPIAHRYERTKQPVYNFIPYGGPYDKPGHIGSGRNIQYDDEGYAIISSLMIIQYS